MERQDEFKRKVRVAVAMQGVQTLLGGAGELGAQASWERRRPACNEREARTIQPRFTPVFIGGSFRSLLSATIPASYVRASRSLQARPALPAAPALPARLRSQQRLRSQHACAPSGRAPVLMGLICCQIITTIDNRQ